MKLRLIAAGAVICLMLAACTEEKPPETTMPETAAPAVTTAPAETKPTQPPTQTVPSTQPTQPVAEPFLKPESMNRPENRQILPLPETLSPETLVMPYWEESLTWSDGYNDNKFTAVIPQIYPFSEDAVALESEIYDLLAPRVEECRQAGEEGTSQVYRSVGYEAWVNGDVLSILVCQETCFDYIEYSAYNLDLVTGSRLDSEALAAKLGMEPEAYTAFLTEAIADAFRSKYEGAAEDEFYHMQLNASISPENLERSFLYLGKNGCPNLVFDLYALAGANSYPTVLPLELP